MSHGRHRKKGQGHHHHHGTASGPLGFLPPGILPSSLSPPGAPPISTTAAATAAAAAFPLPGIDVAATRPEDQTCVAESWQAITGPDALLPDEYVRLPLDELQPVFERDLRRLADKTVNPRERCRLAHYLGNFSCTASGACMYGKAAWYVPTLYTVVKEVKDIYVSGAVVPRPCVAGYAMLALTSIVKQSMRVPFPTSVPPSSGKGHGHHHNGPHAVIDYLLGPVGGGDVGNGGSSNYTGSSAKQQRRRVRSKQDRGTSSQQDRGTSSQQGQEYHGSPRVLCLWTLLKYVTAETARSRGALRTLSCTLELLTTLELACMGRNSALILSQDLSVPPSLPPPLLTQLCALEPSTEATKLIILKAASLILQYTQSRADVCGVAQALGLFEVMGGGEENRVVEEGREGWKAFVAGGGVMPLVAALASLTDRPTRRGGEKGRRRRRRVEEIGEEGEYSSPSTTLDEEEEEEEEESEEEDEEGEENADVSAARQSDRLSILSFLTDLGPAHPTLILPAVSQLIQWAGREGPAYEHERTFALLSLACFLEGGKEGEDARFVAELGLFPVVVRRLQRYRMAIVAGAAGEGRGRSTCECCNGEREGGGDGGGGDEGEGGGQHGELVPAALQVLLSLLLHSEASCQAACADAAEGGPLYVTLNSLLYEGVRASEPTRSRVYGLLLGILTLLVHPLHLPALSPSSGRSTTLSQGLSSGGKHHVMMQKMLHRLSLHSQEDLRSSSVFLCLRDTVRYRKLTCASGGVWRLLVHVLMMAMLVRPVEKEGEERGEEEGEGWQRFLTELQCVLKMVMLQEQEEEQEVGKKEGGSAVNAVHRGGKEPTPPWLEIILARVFKGSGATAGRGTAVEERDDGHASLEVGIAYLSLVVVLGKEGRKEGGMKEAEKAFWGGGTEGLLDYLRSKRAEEMMVQLSLVMREGGMGGGPACEVCKQTAEAAKRQALLRCARCRRVRYCSRECQVGREGRREGWRVEVNVISLVTSLI